MYRLATYNDFLWTNKGWLLPYIEHEISSPLPYMQYFPSLTFCAGSCCGLETSFLVYLAIGSFLLWLVQFIFFFELVHIISFSTGCDMAYSINAVPFVLWLPMYLKVMEYCGGAVFLSTSTTSNYCTVALSTLKTTQYEANDTGEHCKSREIHNSRGCELMEAAATQFFSLQIWPCANNRAPPLTVSVCSAASIVNDGSFFA